MGTPTHEWMSQRDLTYPSIQKHIIGHFRDESCISAVNQTRRTRRKCKKANKVSYRKQTAIERQHACHKQNFLARTWCVVNVVKNILSSSFITMQNLVTISYTLYVNVGGPKNLQYLRIWGHGCPLESNQIKSNHLFKFWQPWDWITNKQATQLYKIHIKTHRFKSLWAM